MLKFLDRDVFHFVNHFHQSHLNQIHTSHELNRKCFIDHHFNRFLKGTGLRQLFVITDSEGSNTDRVLELVRRNAVSTRCFAIGLGSGADIGLVQGIAEATGGRADFISDGEDLIGKVIGQIEA
jgi:hypothetical protein